MTTLALARPVADLPLDMSAVEDELARLRDDEGSYLDDSDFVGARRGANRFFPILSAASVTLLVTYYQTSLALRADTGARTASEKRRIAEHLARDGRYSALLLGSVHRLVKSLLSAQSAERTAPSEALREDLLSAANVAVLEAAASFDPAKMPVFANWVAQRVTPVLRATAQRERFSGVLGRVEMRVLRRLQVAQHDLLVELQRAPTRAELFARVRAQSVEWNSERLRARQPGLSPDEVRARVAAAMRKSGESAVLEQRLEMLSTHLVSVDLSLEDVVGHDTATYQRTLDSSLVLADAEEADVAGEGQSLVTLLSWAFDGLSADERAAMLQAMENAEAAPISRAAITRARARLLAPHAQYAWLGASLAGQFVEPVVTPTDIVAHRARHKSFEVLP